MKEGNPVNKLRFYGKNDPEKAKILRKEEVTTFEFIILRASLCKILISSFAHKMDFTRNFL